MHFIGLIMQGNLKKSTAKKILVIFYTHGD